ncbi:M56 family metallopeptidase [Caulobacter sp. DWR1-3-2b1]|uniref:M56 family metallopeptidase n=1 Tax=Caulobacter sp. DWR1-3-2b1 TaxID=2804670 RepID=UPI003CE68DD8
MIELLALALTRVQLAAAAAIVLVLLLRVPVRNLLGPRLAYGLWALVPAAAAASIFPSLAETLEVGAPTAPLAPGLALKVLVLWLVGVALFAGFMLWQEYAFRRMAAQGKAGPAVMGALWPRIVLPADFEVRFDTRERGLILLHERTHIHRGDPIANLVLAACRALGWCNPLIHLGAAFTRIDQELACDATVLALRNDIRADYAKALLKVSMFRTSSPLACGWGTHPLILRVSSLKRHEPSQRREVAGFIGLIVLSMATFLAVWSVAPRGLEPRALAPTIDMEAVHAAQAARGFALPYSAAMVAMASSASLRLAVSLSSL